MSEHLQYSPEYIARHPIMNDALTTFFGELEGLDEQRVLEVGTLRWSKNPTHHKALFPKAKRYIMSDVAPGEDVDVVCDLHRLEDRFHPGLFNVFWSSSVFEHLHSPWIAAEQILKLLPPGGLFFIQTHQAFPIHGYPNDYFRFSREAMEHLFRGASKLVSCYEYPVRLQPENRDIAWNHAADSYLNVCLAGVK